MARTRPNVYLELSTWQPKWQYPDELFFAIHRMRAAGFPGLNVDSLPEGNSARLLKLD